MQICRRCAAQIGGHDGRGAAKKRKRAGEHARVANGDEHRQACFGLLLIYTTNGLYYRYLDLPDLQKNWSENRAECFPTAIRSGNDTGATVTNLFSEGVVLTEPMRPNALGMGLWSQSARASLASRWPANPFRATTIQ
jgi:hypothetical protein